MIRMRAQLGVVLWLVACAGAGPVAENGSHASATPPTTSTQSPPETSNTPATSSVHGAMPRARTGGTPSPTASPNSRAPASVPPATRKPDPPSPSVTPCRPGEPNCQHEEVTPRSIIRDFEFGSERGEQKKLIDDNPDVGYFSEIEQPLRYVPDKLSIDALVRRLPCKDSREDFRATLRGESDHFQIATEWLDSTPNDGEHEWQLVWARMLLCNVVFLFDASGALRDTLAFESRGRFSMSDLVIRDREPDLPELVFEEVVGSSVCCYPVVNHVIRITSWGKFKKVFEHARSYDHVGPGVRYDYWFQFEYEPNRIKVRKLFPDAENRPIEHFTYQPHLDRYVPTPETRALLQEEARREREARARDDYYGP